MALLAAVVVVVYVLDQVTKALAVARLVEGEPVELVPGVLDLYLLYNPGAAFSLATGLTWVLTLVAAGVVVAIVLVARRLGSRVWAAALGLLLGGALGNLTDRLLREPGFAEGHVVDFLRLPRWPVFNLADSAVVLGAVLVVVLTFRGVGVDGSREPRGRAAPPEPGGTDGPDRPDGDDERRHDAEGHDERDHEPPGTDGRAADAEEGRGRG